MPILSRGLLIWKPLWGRSVDWIFRLAILGGQGVAEGKSALRLSNAEKKSYMGVLMAGKVLDSGDSGIKTSALGYYHGAQIARAAVMHQAVQLGQDLDKAVLEQIDFGANQQNKYPIKAADLMAFAEGRELGDLLKKGERIWVQSDFTKTKEAVLLEINRLTLSPCAIGNPRKNVFTSIGVLPARCNFNRSNAPSPQAIVRPESLLQNRPRCRPNFPRFSSTATRADRTFTRSSFITETTPQEMAIAHGYDCAPSSAECLPIYLCLGFDQFSWHR